MTGEGEPERLRILAVEDNPRDVELLREHLEDVPEELPVLEAVETLDDAFALLETSDFDAVLLDLNLPGSGGLDTLDAVLDGAPEVPVIVLTGAADEDLGLEAVRRGAADFLPKEELGGRLLLRVVRHARERQRRFRSETRLRSLIGLLQSVSATANEAERLEEALRVLVGVLPRGLGWELGHVYVLEGERLRALPVWYPEGSPRFEGFRRASEETEFVPGEGLVGAALETGRVQHMTGVAGDEGFVRREAAEGLERGLVIPVSDGRRVVAVLELFSTRDEPVDEGLLEAARYVEAQLERVAERERAQAELQQRMRELRTLYGATHELTRTDVPLERRLGELVELVPAGFQHPGITEARLTYGDLTFETAGFRETPWTLSEEIVAGDGVSGRLEAALTEERPEKDLGPFLEEERELLESLALSVGEAVARERLEKEFLQAQKMEAVGRLSGGVAHDFNNLLTVIRAHTDFLLMDLAATGPLAEEVRAIQDAANRAAELTNQLLAFSREQVLRPRVLDLNEVVEAVRRLISRVLGEDIRIETDLGDDVPAVEVDPGQLEQALLNLAVNARDAMPEGGTLTLATTAEEIGADRAAARTDLDAGAYARLAVSDTGVGMDEETRGKVFEPFFSTKGREKGTGLGLAMVYGIVTQSGGTIDVESEPGEGATFVIRFPAVDETPEAIDREALAASFDSDVTGRVLVIEDDSSVRRVTTAILRRADFDVTAVPDAESGFRALEEGDFDVVLTDLVLPGVSGRELIERIRERSPELHLVAMSGYAEGSPGRRGDLAAEILFIQKPFSPEALLEAVREAVVRRAA